MPTYEYRCLKCKKIFEQFQSIKDEPLKKCKFCSGKVERIIGAGGGFILKGNGFYATDYRKGDYKEREKKEKSASCPAKSDKCKGCPKADS
ncbi:MAG: zinc ribbon domain-containing protein [Candidatus Omnitrophica bacterium]|nr:zinc ribbon domain-containing protein [Candidatus Omnitrophota bacterium]